MEIKIFSKAEQPLLSRTELHGMISFESATPSRVEVRKKIAEAVKSENSLITITSIDTDFGQKSARVAAYVYKTKEDLAIYASKTSKSRNAPKEKKDAGGEAPSAAAPVPAEKKGVEEKDAKAAHDKPKEQTKREEKKQGAE